MLVTTLDDVKGDKKVRVLNFILIASYVGHHATDYTFHSTDWYSFMSCDLNGDGNINELDLIACASHLGQH